MPVKFVLRAYGEACSPGDGADGGSRDGGGSSDGGSAGDAEAGGAGDSPPAFPKPATARRAQAHRVRCLRLRMHRVAAAVLGVAFASGVAALSLRLRGRASAPNRLLQNDGSIASNRMTVCKSSVLRRRFVEEG